MSCWKKNINHWSLTNSKSSSNLGLEREQKHCLIPFSRTEDLYKTRSSHSWGFFRYVSITSGESVSDLSSEDSLNKNSHFPWGSCSEKAHAELTPTHPQLAVSRDIIRVPSATFCLPKDQVVCWLADLVQYHPLRSMGLVYLPTNLPSQSTKCRVMKKKLYTPWN